MKLMAFGHTSHITDHQPMPLINLEAHYVLSGIDHLSGSSQAPNHFSFSVCNQLYFPLTLCSVMLVYL